MSTNLTKRFFDYLKIDTKSDPESETCPSTEKQLNLAKVLVKELNDMGLTDVSVDENGYVMGTLKSNTDKKVPTIGLIAHMDTAPDMSGANVQPTIHNNYDGNDIVLNEEKNIILSPKDFPELKNYIGQDIITTDGTTLLGADNKAGIAEIMEAVDFLINNPDIKHGDIKIGFTPDEEIGRGANKFNVEKFNADFAYTIDGGEIGELEYENFNAAGAKVYIKGRNVHPGTAKNKMKNSITISHEFNSMLPADQVPEFTTGYEGFFHLYSTEGSVEESKLQYIIRDHCRESFESKKELMNSVADFINKKYGEGTVTVEMTDQYYNMKEKVLPVIEIVDNAKLAMEEVGVKPIIKAIRGGTDGARLSYMGLPCPNIFTGGHNFHGRYEYIPVQSMDKAVEVIVKLLHNYAK